MGRLPRLGKRELICLLLFTCNYVVFVLRSFLFLWVLGMDYVILLWHSLSLPYNYFEENNMLKALQCISSPCLAPCSSVLKFCINIEHGQMNSMKFVKRTFKKSIATNFFTSS